MLLQVTEELVTVSEFPSQVVGVLWDTYHPDRNVFVVFDNTQIYTYMHIRNSIRGMLSWIYILYPVRFVIFVFYVSVDSVHFEHAVKNVTFW